MLETVDRRAAETKLAERLHAQYGERLKDVYLLDASPYPDGGGEGIHVVAVLDEAEGFAHLDRAADIAYSVDAEYDYATFSNVYPVSGEAFENGSSFPALRAREEGRRL